MCHKSSPLHQNAIENANLPPLSLGVHLAPSSYNKNQRFSFATSQSNNNEYNRQRHIDLINGRALGTPTLNRPPVTPRQATTVHPAHFHGTLSNRRRRPKKWSEKDGKTGGDVDSDEEDARLLLLPGDAELWQPISAGAVTATLGKQTRVSAGNQGVMPNPDDILPKQAWTDFSGTDDWPNFVASEKQNGCGSNSRKIKRSDRQVVKESPYSNGDVSESENVLVNSISPPVPKERRLKPSAEQINRFEEVSSTGLDLEVYESLVDSEPENLNGHESEKLNNQIELNSKKTFNSKLFSPSSEPKTERDSLSFCDNDSEGSCEGDQDEKEKSSPTKFPPRPTQTFRSTKFISVTNSPKATPNCTTNLLDR
jgi:hypothetical protein